MTDIFVGWSAGSNVRVMFLEVEIQKSKVRLIDLEVWSKKKGLVNVFGGQTTAWKVNVTL